VEAGLATVNADPWWSGYIEAKEKEKSIAERVEYGKNMVARAVEDNKEGEILVGGEKVGKVSRWPLSEKEPCESCGKGGRKASVGMRITAFKD